MSKPAASQREKARLLYADAGIPMQAVAEQLGISRSTLTSWARLEGWPPRTLTKPPAAQKFDPKRPTVEESAEKKQPVRKVPPRRLHPKNLTLQSLLAKAKTEQHDTAKREGPKRRRRSDPEAPDDRKDLIDRLYRLVHHNVRILESRMSDENASDASGPERDMRVVGNLVRSVEKLKELEPEQSKRDNSGANAARAVLSAEEEDIIRRRVVEHILKLRERKRREGGDR